MKKAAGLFDRRLFNVLPSSNLGLSSASYGKAYQTQEAAAQSEHAARLGYVLYTDAEAVNIDYVSTSASAGVMSKIDAPAGKLRDIGDRNTVVNQSPVIPAVSLHLREVPDHRNIGPLSVDIRG